MPARIGMYGYNPVSDPFGGAQRPTYVYPPHLTPKKTKHEQPAPHCKDILDYLQKVCEMKGRNAEKE